MIHRTAPPLATERLTLRELRADDFDPFARLFASERSRYIDGPKPRHEAWTAFVADAGQWALLGFGSWIIERRDDGVTVGEVGLNHPAHFPEREMGWVLWDGCEGHGYATEAAFAVRAFAYDDLGWTTLVSYIDPANVASTRVAERLGATLDPAAPTPFDEPTKVYRHPPPG